jgi:ketosteroid isomerase-like protein
MSSSIEEMRTTAGRFAMAVIDVDSASIAATAAPDITWDVPGHSHISGTAQGIKGVTALARTLKDYAYNITVEQLTFGSETVAVVIRGTGERNGVIIDVGVVNVLEIRQRKVASVRTHFSDIASANAYFS